MADAGLDRLPGLLVGTGAAHWCAQCWALVSASQRVQLQDAGCLCPPACTVAWCCALIPAAVHSCRMPWLMPVCMQDCAMLCTSVCQHAWLQDAVCWCLLARMAAGCCVLVPTSVHGSMVLCTGARWHVQLHNPAFWCPLVCAQLHGAMHQCFPAPSTGEYTDEQPPCPSSGGAEDQLLGSPAAPTLEERYTNQCEKFGCRRYSMGPQTLTPVVLLGATGKPGPS